MVQMSSAIGRGIHDIQQLGGDLGKVSNIGSRSVLLTASGQAGLAFLGSMPHLGELSEDDAPPFPVDAGGTFAPAHPGLWTRPVHPLRA